MIILKLETLKIAYFTPILTIQVKKKGTEEVKIWKSWDFSDEKAMLQDFRDWFLQEKDKIFLGYNLLKFDLPVLLLKLSTLEKFDDFSLKLNRSNILDLFVILTFLKKGNIKSFDYYCQNHNIATVSRERILELYTKKEYPQMEEAIITNLSAFEELFNKVLEKNA